MQKLEKNRLTVLDLSAELSLDRSTVSRLAKELVKKGYCIYQENDKDSRSHYLELTVLGKKMLTEIHAGAIKQVQAALDRLTEEEKESVTKGLSLYAKALKQKLEVKG